VGKTIVSAVLVEALQADYWKPIQCGRQDYTDTQKVQNLVSNQKSKFHKEAYNLSRPMSPYAAAAIDGIALDLGAMALPATENHLIVEGTGGLMEPLHTGALMIDLVKQFAIPVIIVAKNYPGSLNHTLLTIDVLRSENIPVGGIIFSGVENTTDENFIVSHTQIKLLGRIEYEEVMSKAFIKRNADKIRPILPDQKSIYS
jgi:dethiobiotin synthetase